MFSLAFVVLVLSAGAATAFAHLWDAHYLHYGNELDQARRFWNLTSSFLEAEYYSKLRACFGVKGPYAAQKCFAEVNERYKWHAALWPHSTSADTYRPLPDCKYEVRPVSLEYYTPVPGDETLRLEYSFVVEQSACWQRVGFAGGSAFEVFGSNRLFLAGCTYLDSQDGLYHVSCVASLPPPLLHGNDVACLSLTIVMLMEHLDIFSEVQVAQVMWAPSQPRGYRYVSARHMVSDNVTHCFPVPASPLSVSKRPQNSALLPPRLTIYSAEWHSSALSSKTATAAAAAAADAATYFGNGSFHSALEFKMWKLQGPSANASTLHSQHQHQHRLVRLSSAPPERLAAIGVSRNPNLEGAFLHRNGDVVHMVGASHIRFLFDALVEYALGPSLDGSDGMNRKHGQASRLNLHFMDKYLADDLADALSALCAQPRPAGSGRTVLVFHTGAWDLVSSGPRRLVRESNSLPKVLGALETILARGCAGAQHTHVVWLLTMPHPVCWRDDAAEGSECEDKRGYRWNPVIAAVNKHLIDAATALMRRLSRSSVAAATNANLTIIDTYSIIHPRLAFDDGAEAACVNHFLCRVNWDKTGSTIFSPGGKAVFDATLQALSL